MHQNAPIFHSPWQDGQRHRGGQCIEDEHTLAAELGVTLDPALRFVPMIAHDNLDRFSSDTALHIDQLGEILCRLGNLRRGKGIGFAEVVADANLEWLSQRLGAEHRSANH